MPKKSTFTGITSVPSTYFFDVFGQGFNYRISKSNLFQQITSELGTPGVQSINDLSGALQLIAGTNVSIDINQAEGTFTFNGSLSPTDVQSVAFDLSAGISVSEGELAWNDIDKTLDLGAPGGTTVQLGQEVLIRVLNNTGSAFADGDVVYITGAQGNRVTAALAQADSASGNSTIGVVTQPIPDNQEGFITVLGLVRDFDTSAWLEGDELWLSASVAGEITNVMPSLPNSAISIGFVSRSHASVGSIFVRVIRGVASVTGDTNITIAGTPNNPQVTLDSVQTFTNFSLNTTDVSGTPNIIAANSQGVIGWDHDGVNTSVVLQHNGSDVLTVDENGATIPTDTNLRFGTSTIEHDTASSALTLIGSLGAVRIGDGTTDLRFTEGTFDSSNGMALRPSPDDAGGILLVDLGNGAGGGEKRFVVGSLAVGEGFVIEATIDAGSDLVKFAAFGGAPIVQPVLSTGTPEDLITALGSTSGLSWIDDSSVVFDTVIDPVAGADDDNKDVFPPENPQRHNTIKFDTTGGAQTAHMETGTWLPGDTVRFVDYASNFTTANLTIDFETHNFEGVAAQTLVMSVDDGAVTLEYIDSTRGFQRISVV